MAKIVFSNEKIRFELLESPAIFHCSECGQMGNEAPVRSQIINGVGKGKISSYHQECSIVVIRRIQEGDKRTTEQKLVIPDQVKVSTPAPVSRLKPIEDEELERKKRKLRAILQGNEIETIAHEATKEKDEAKPKARIDVNEFGNIYLVHKFDKNLVTKYHFIKQIKWQDNFKYWNCDIETADFETCRFLMKIYKEAPEYEWLVSEEAYNKIKARLDYHEENIRQSKEIKEIKSKDDIDIDLSFLKLPPFPYQKVGIAFLDKIHGVGMVGDSMGLGKCQIKSTTYTNFGVHKIEDLFKHLQDQNLLVLDKKEGEGEWYKVKKPLKTLALVNNKTPYVPVSHFYREKVSTMLRKITLTDGTELYLSQPHKLLTLDGWTNDLKTGDYVLVPKKIDFKGIEVDEDLIFFLSWLISEGHELVKGNRFSITQKDKTILVKILKRIKTYCKKNSIKINKPSIVFREENDTYYLRITSAELVKHFSSFYVFGKLSAQKKIPSIVLNSTLENSRVFLKNFFEAEGSVSNHQNIVEITSASKDLIESLQFMLRRFGVWLRVSSKKKMATNGKKIKRIYYTGIIGGTSLRVFKKEIGFISKYKNENLSKLCEKYTNDNVDVIPTLDLCKKMMELVPLPIRRWGISRQNFIESNLSRTTSNTLLEKTNEILEGIAEKEYLKLKRSKWTDKTLAVFENIDYVKLSFLRDILKNRIEANAFYPKIKSIEYFSHEDYVYDLSVPKYHNYIANTHYCHNTVQSIGYSSARNLKTIVVCPASLKYNWQNEINKFTNRTSFVMTEKLPAEFDPKKLEYDYYIINYEQLQKYEKFFTKAKFDCVILDESHYIKDLQAKRTKSVYKFFKKVPNRILLSGTPIKNRPLEFYSQLKFLRPDLFSNKQNYALRYCDAKENAFGGWDYSGASNLEELNRKISNFYIRREKKEVLKELPEKTVSLVELDLNVNERNEYNRINKDFYKFLTDEWKHHGKGMQTMKVGGNHLSKMMELKQFCSHQKVNRVIEYVREFLESSEDRKIIIFSQFIHTQRKLRDAFPGQTVSILGENSDIERQEAVDRFQSDPKIRVFVGSTIAAGIGITLTAADTVCFADLMWSPSDHLQAEDRAYRIGQKNNVQVNYFVFKDTIEELIWKTLSKKLGIIVQALEGKAQESSMNEDVVRAVFKEILADFKAQREKAD